MDKEIAIGDIVRHKAVLRGTDLYVCRIFGDTLTLRYGDQGKFATQELFLHEVELFVEDEDEYI